MLVAAAFLTCLHPSALQVAAFMALMECVRGERPGVFNNRLFHRAFERLVSGVG